MRKLELPGGTAGLRFAPDGTKLLATGANGYQMSAADGSAMQVVDAHGIAAEWAPDSLRFALTVSGGGRQNPEHQPAALFIVNAADLSRRQVGVSDFPAYVQFLQNGDLCYVQDARLHIWHAATSEDESPAGAAPITGSGDDIPNTQPFRLSEDERYVAVSQDGILTVQDLKSGDTHVVTNSLDFERWSGYAWSPSTPTLAYADLSASAPAIHLYDAVTDSSKTLLQSDASGTITPVDWSADGAFVIFAYHPSGTQYTAGAQVSAIRVQNGMRFALFSNAEGLHLFDAGQKLLFFREDPANESGAWIATLEYR